MATTIGHAAQRAAWALVSKQHGVVARRQLLELGFTAAAIRHRLAKGRLHVIYPGVYAVGRPKITRKGRWMAAVLACGEGAVLSHTSAAVLIGLRDADHRLPEVSVPHKNRHRPKDIAVHRRRPEALADSMIHNGIPVTSPLRTLVDLAARAERPEVETLINRADKHDLVDPETLRRALEGLKGEPGVPLLREVLDRATFALTDSELERRFLPIARRAGLPRPETQRMVNGYRVDFFWPELGLVVETDGLRYHRTAAQQARDAIRDNAHRAAGLVPVRFTHAQVRHEAEYVERILVAVTPNLPRH